MKGTYVFISFAVAATLGCKAPEAQKAEAPIPAPTPSPALSQLKTEGCSVLTTKGVVKIECADGSKAEAGVPRYHIKDGSGASLDNLMFLQNWGQVGVLAINRKSGNLLSFDQTGNLTKVTRTLFESFDCSGQVYLFSSDFIVKNKVMLNAGGAPVSVEALRVVGYQPATVSFNSEYKNGACGPWTGSASGGTIVEPTDLDDTDPIQIGLPIEIVFDEAA